MPGKLTTEPLVVDTALIDQILADMVTLMGTEFTTCNASVSTSLGAMSSTMTLSDELGNSQSVTQRTAGPSVSVVPMGVSLGPGEAQTFVATVKDGNGVVIPGAVVTWQVTLGGNGTISSNGHYVAPATIAAQTYDTITVTYTATGSNMAIQVSLHP